jgi:cell division septal protein FtsQ
MMFRHRQQKKRHRAKQGRSPQLRARKRRSAMMMSGSGSSQSRARGSRLRADTSAPSFVARYVYVVLTVVLVGVSAYLLLYSRFLSVGSAADVTVEGNSRVAIAEIREVMARELSSRYLFVIPKTSYFLFPSGAIRAAISEELDHIDAVSIEKQFPNGIRVRVIEKRPVLVWQSGQSFYVVDGSGHVIGQADAETIPELALPVVIDDLGRTVSAGSLVAFPELVQFVTAIGDLIHTQTPLRVSQLRVPSFAAEEIHVYTTDGFRLLFDPRHDPEDRVGVLIDLLNQEIKDKRTSLEYIDMRIENWAYYR